MLEDTQEVEAKQKKPQAQVQLARRAAAEREDKSQESPEPEAKQGKCSGQVLRDGGNPKKQAFHRISRKSTCIRPDPSGT